MPDLDENFFIRAGIDLTSENIDFATVINISKKQLQSRWNTQHGTFMLNRWKAHGFRRAILDEMVGKYSGHTDIRGISLYGETLRGIDFSSVDFFGSDLEKVIFENVDLRNSWLSECNLRGAKFKWTKMDGVLLDNIQFNGETSFLGVNLSTINFTLASLIEESAIIERRIQHLTVRSPIFSWFLKLTCDYGRSFIRFCSCCAILILFFGVCYFLLPQSIIPKSFLNCLILSFLSFITFSWKDIVVNSVPAKILFVIEACIGYLMLGVLVAILVRRTIGR